jgi:twitching motility two-component system response regulator PilG
MENQGVTIAAAAPTSNLTGVKVMVIDDSNTIRRSAEIFLVQAGCHVILADDGFDALAKITDHQPDVIFCDIVMPRLDGYQTCALIKRNHRFAATPVIMLSSKDGLFDRARGRMVGSDEYLTKPFTKESLLRTVDSHTSARRDGVSDVAGDAVEMDFTRGNDADPKNSDR